MRNLAYKIRASKGRGIKSVNVKRKGVVFLVQARLLPVDNYQKMLTSDELNMCHVGAMKLARIQMIVTSPEGYKKEALSPPIKWWMRHESVDRYDYKENEGQLAELLDKALSSEIINLSEVLK